jgi:ATP-dependent helicase/nuclease subunit B
MVQQLDLFASGPDASMRVLAHDDPFVLEQELSDRVRTARAAGSCDPVLVLTPTSLLARHLQRRIAERAGAVLGIDVLPYRGFVHRVLEAAGDTPLRPLSKRVLEAVLGIGLERVSRRNRLARFVGERPRARRALLASLNDLREAGIAASSVRREADAPRERDLAAIYKEYEAELQRLSGDRMTDEAGLVAAAVTRAPGYARRYVAVLAYGAYELVGMHLDLLLAAGRHCGITAMIPAHPGSPAGRYGERFARRHLLQGGGDPLVVDGDGRDGSLLGPRLSMLYDEEAAPEALAGDRIVFRHTQGAPAEVAVALRHALRAVEQGTPPNEIALVARTLEPYAATLEEVIEDNRALGPGDDEDWSPYSTSLQSPLRREPAIHDLLLLLRVLAEDFPRAATVELLCSPRVEWRTVSKGPPPQGDHADRFSREAGILGGLREWTDELPAALERAALPSSAKDSDEQRAAAERRNRFRREVAERIAGCLQALAARFPAEPRGWGGHAKTVRTIVEDVLPVPGVPGASLADLLDELDDLARIDERPDVPFDEMLARLERAVDETRIPHQERDGGGIRVLDAMQARGLTFERVFLLGVQSELFPRRQRPDPFLRDDLRIRLRERSGRPLGVKSESDDEERLLLAMILGAARSRIDVSWQRADDSGRAATPSLALREVARVALGRPDLEPVRRAAERISSHPKRRLEELAEGPGLLSGREEELLVALRAPNPGSAMGALLARDDRLTDALRMIRATEEFAPRSPEYDGRVGDAAPPADRFSVTGLQELGRCPLRFFFGHVLRVRTLDEEASVYDIPAPEIGRRVHRVLESLYGRLADENLLFAGDVEPLVGRALELLGPAWTEEMHDIEGRRSRRLGFLWELNSEMWKASLAAFLAWDLNRIAEQGFTAIELERPVAATVDFGNGVSAEIAARFDRVLSKEDGRTIGDYKTGYGGYFDNQVKTYLMLRGGYMQAPLYHLLADEQARIEILGVGPSFDYDDPDTALAKFGGFATTRDIRGGFLETVRVLLRLAQSGTYPINEGINCRFCSYVQACRKNHPPTVERESHAPDAADLRDIRRKRDKLPSLTLVRAEYGSDAAGGEDLTAQLARSLAPRPEAER